MKQKETSRLASAVAAAVGLSTLALASGVQADTDRIEDELTGDVLIFPYYTVRDGWTSLVNVTNVKPYTIVAKVRYRESYNSRDVLDFNIVLSPYDVWTGWVTEGPNGPRLYTRDNTCTTPIFEDAGDGSRYVDFTDIGYQKDGGPKGIDRAREGHYEFLTMAQFYPGAEDEEWKSDGSYPNWEDRVDIQWSKGDPKYPTAYYAKHVDGKPRNCEMVDSRFEANAPVPSETKFMEGDFDSDGDPLAEFDVYQARMEWSQNGNLLDSDDETLKGNFGLVNFGTGIAAGGIALAPKNMFCDWDSGGDGTHDLITAQQWPWFMEPTLYSRCFDSGSGNNRYSGLWGWTTNYSADMDVAGINNEWSTNPNTGAETDWIVTFPTKEFHVDISDTDPYAAISSARMLKGTSGGPQCTYSGPGDKPWNCDLWDNGDPDVDPDNSSDNDAETFREAFIMAGGMYFEYQSSGGGCPGDTDCDYEYKGFEEYFGEHADGQSCDTVVYNLFDREETGVPGSGTSISPAPPQPVDSLCYETNILAFQDDSTLGSALAVKVDTSVLASGAAAGWLKLFMGDGCSLTSTIYSDLCDFESELPALGFAVKSRDFGDPTRNFGVLLDHAYDD